MGTRSTIAVHKADGSWALAYCHWDGYPDYNGVMLRDHYNSQELAESLVGLGDMSTLNKYNGCPEGHTFETPVKDHTVYYGRDRGEKGVDAKTGSVYGSLRYGKDSGIEWEYVFYDGEWLVQRREYGNANNPYYKLSEYLEAMSNSKDQEDFTAPKPVVFNEHKKFL